MRKQLSPKSQEMLDKMMEEHRKEAPQIVKIVGILKNLHTPEGREMLAKHLQKPLEEKRKSAPIFPRERI